MTMTARPWLKGIHQRRSERTLTLVQQAILELKNHGKRVSIASIVAAARDVDPQRAGISHSALLNNSMARELYQRNRDWHPGRAHRARRTATPDILLAPVKLDRNPDAARQRLGKMTKTELIGRLLAIEQAYSKLRGDSLDAEIRQVEREWMEFEQSKGSPSR